MLRTVLVSICLFSLGLGLCAQNATVVVMRRDKESEQPDVRITQDDIDGVKASKGPAKMSWKIQDIVSIRYKGEPEPYKRGMNSLTSGEYEKAAELFAESLGSKGTERPWLETYANYYRGEALRQAGKFMEAIEAYDAVLKADSKSRFVPDVYMAQGSCHLQRGAEGAAAAKKAMESLRLLAKQKNLDERYELMASLGLARVELAAGDANRALSDLEGLMAKCTNHQSVANLARLEIGNAHVKKKEFGRAEQFFVDILSSKERPAAEVIAGASNGLGDCEYQQGKYDKALFTYSRVYSLFLDRADQSHRVAHALYYGGMAFELAAGKISDDAEKKKYFQRASKLLRKAAREFPNTSGGKAAREKLGMS